MVAQFPILKSAQVPAAPKFSLSACEFSLVQDVDGQVLGRLYSPVAIPLNPESSRKLVDVRFGGKVILFESSYADYRHLANYCAKSNVPATRYQTKQLLDKLAQRQWAQVKAQPAPAPVKAQPQYKLVVDVWESASTSTALCCPITIPVQRTLALPPARPKAEPICTEKVNELAWTRKELVAIAKTLGHSIKSKATKSDIISLICA